MRIPAVHKRTHPNDIASVRLSMTCNYCTREAVVQIPCNPGDVCRMHAIEFWKGLLRYAKTHPPVKEREHESSDRERQPGGRTPGRERAHASAGFVTTVASK